MKTPDEWALALGLCRTSRRLDGSRVVAPSAQHAAAAGLHRWAAYSYHAGKPIELSESDYRAAVEAAAQPNSSGVYVPHAPALSRY